MDDAERFALIDAVRVDPFKGRLSDKRTTMGVKRFVRVVGTSSVLRAACGCYSDTSKPGSVCPSCGGAVLSHEELNR
jgi:hypothetical protein